LGYIWVRRRGGQPWGGGVHDRVTLGGEKNRVAGEKPGKGKKTGESNGQGEFCRSPSHDETWKQGRRSREFGRRTVIRGVKKKGEISKSRIRKRKTKRRERGGER